MKNFLSSKKNLNLILGILAAVIFGQSLFIAKLYSEKDDKSYQVNLVPIKTEKDSIDYMEMKNNLTLVDNTVRELNSFLASKNLSDGKIEMLAKDSISNAVYLAKQTNRYSQHLVDLQNKLQQVPLGIPTDGYISSQFGKRINPIPTKTVMLASMKSPKAEPKIVEEKDSLGNVIKKAAPVIASQNNSPAEKDQIQFHKGLDIAVAYGTDVRSAAAGKVIFAGVKGGYGNCVIISHGNGLDTLYGHLSSISVKANDVVKVNDVIAKSGNTGRSTGPHLHYEVHKNNTPVNPKLFMNL
ncbi:MULTISPECIES: M23 family metallopeptidase [unclassified Kaistella]|uniref:M23 family metallopeptidase n=1 Tax=unclassified Kaistella TaxID=2762626 RepID=UPI002735F0F3|nr:MULTISPECIES: M23 family metallopeptidase [unclassified Kaistella]MDP2455169.1 M23 family metallopeptidase [Kaistella sp. SH11-4b]MDP2458143.1 M23 family metallopeptidase [Kaistella sp. SH40-3]MDP2460936.1 M23 family metallopeptidase [Kaistella sp. SH19-2b]